MIYSLIIKNVSISKKKLNSVTFLCVFPSGASDRRVIGGDAARGSEKHKHRRMSRRDATEDGFKYVFAILRSLYPHVQTLEEFADGLVFSDGRKAVLLEEKDGARFQKLTRGLIICACTPPHQLRVPAQVPHTPV